ncbi:MAG: hypothetical protein SNJ61_10865, partial [Fimbriimonadaceae bacterium]
GLAEPVGAFVALSPLSARAGSVESVTYIPRSVLAYLSERTPEQWSDLLSGRRAEVRIGAGVQ